MKKQTEKQLQLNFNLKQVKEEKKLTQIMLVTTVQQQRMRVYTKLRVEPQHWDHSRHRCYLPEHLTARERKRLQHINEQIEKLVYYLSDIDEKLAAKGQYLSSNILQESVRENLKNERIAFNPLNYMKEVVEDYEKNVNRRGRKGIRNTRVTYLSAINRLERYNKLRQTPISSFDDFNKRFFKEFTDYLYNYTYGKNREKNHYTQGTIINTLKVIKNLLHRAYDNEITTNNYFMRVQTTLPADYCEKIYLTEEEIQKIATVKTYTSQECEVRDLFVIACYTALRISDIQQLGQAMIQRGVLSLYQTKTKDLVEIPILKEIAPLVEQYQESGFPLIQSMKANLIIKTLAARSGINEQVSYKEHRG
ncbi:MAG: site-specific integrase, partial [Bacteroides sp.]